MTGPKLPPPTWQATRGLVGGAAGRLLSFDPGHTTGWAWWVDGELVEAGQVNTSPESGSLLALDDLLFDRFQPTAVVLERYAIYPHKLDAHTLSSVYTLQVIGAIKLLCEMVGVSWREQGAGDVKRFVPTDRLKAWGMYQPKRPHANDAVRHGAYYLTFRKG